VFDGGRVDGHIIDGPRTQVDLSDHVDPRVYPPRQLQDQAKQLAVPGATWRNGEKCCRLCGCSCCNLRRAGRLPKCCALAAACARGRVVSGKPLVCFWASCGVKVAAGTGLSLITGARPVRLLLGAGGATSCAAGWDGAVGDGRNSARGVGTAA
jgi:hypothetical protein